MKEKGDHIDVRDGSIEITPESGRFLIPQYEIVQYFSEVQSKNEALEGVLEFGNNCFTNLAVFSCFSNRLQLLKGRGDNVRKSSPLGSFEIDQNTIIRRAVVNKFPYRGPVPVGPDEKVAFSRFFNRYAEEVFIYPGSIQGGNTDILFYADGLQGSRESCLATFEYVVDKAVLSLQSLWVQKQLKSI